MIFAIVIVLFSLAVGLGVWSFLTSTAQKDRFQERLSILTSAKQYKEEVLKAAHISPHKFYIENLLFLGIPILFSILWQQAAPASGPVAIKLLMAILAGLSLKLFLKIYMVRRYRRLIEEALPTTLDLLVVCLEAGMSLNASLVRLAEETKGTPLSNELRYTFYEINVGLPAEDAFRNFANRTKVPDIKSFVITLIESEKLGMKLSDTLRNHSALLRETIRIRTREKILKLPIKLLFPLAFLIMPSIFVVLIGPSVLNIIPFLEKINTAKNA